MTRLLFRNVGRPALPLFTYALSADGKACASTIRFEGARKLSFFPSHVKIFMWQFCASDKAATRNSRRKAAGSRRFGAKERPLVE
jgi:hypothetical protein